MSMITPALPLERLPELVGNIEGYQQGRKLTRLAVLLTLTCLFAPVSCVSHADARLVSLTESGPFPPPVKPSFRAMA